jgi:hypothetical protein
MLVVVFSGRSDSVSVVEVSDGLAIEAAVPVSVGPILVGCSVLSAGVVWGYFVGGNPDGVSDRTVAGLPEDGWRHPVHRNKIIPKPINFTVFNIRKKFYHWKPGNNKVPDSIIRDPDV